MSKKNTVGLSGKRGLRLLCSFMNSPREKLSSSEVVGILWVKCVYNLLLLIHWLTGKILERNVDFDREVLQKKMDNPDSSESMRYGKHIVFGFVSDGIQIDMNPSRYFDRNPMSVREWFSEICDLITMLKKIQMERSKSMRIFINSFWLRRETAVSLLQKFLAQEGLKYHEYGSDDLSTLDYLEYGAMFSLKQFAHIKKVWKAWWAITIPGWKRARRKKYEKFQSLSKNRYFNLYS